MYTASGIDNYRILIGTCKTVSTLSFSSSSSLYIIFLYFIISSHACVSSLTSSHPFINHASFRRALCNRHRTRRGFPFHASRKITRVSIIAFRFDLSLFPGESYNHAQLRQTSGAQPRSSSDVIDDRSRMLVKKPLRLGMNIFLKTINISSHFSFFDWLTEA